MANKKALRAKLEATKTPPACFSSLEEYRAWYTDMVSSLHDNEDEISPCRDCNARYQSRMLNQGKCANPGVVFIEKISYPNGRRCVETIGQRPEDMTQGYRGYRRRYA